jgi:hypothetical protein
MLRKRLSHKTIPRQEVHNPLVFIMKYTCNIHSCPFKCHKIISSAIQSHLKCHYYNPMKLNIHYGLHGMFGIIMAFCGIIPWFFPVDFIEFHYGWRCTDVCKTPGMGTVAWGTLKRPSAMAETKPHLIGAFLPGTGQKNPPQKNVEICRDVVFALNVAHFPNGKPWVFHVYVSLPECIFFHHLWLYDVI